MAKRNSKDLKQWSGVSLMATLLVILVVQFTFTMDSLNRTISDLSEIQYLSSGTQRCVQMYLRESQDTQFVYIIAKQSEQYLNTTLPTALQVVQKPVFAPLAREVLEDWQNIAAIGEKNVVDENLLEIAADNYFDSMNKLTSAVRQEISAINAKALNLQYLTLTLVLVMICGLFHRLVLTSADLKKNREFAKLASIDVATGLFNRSRCQELFKDTTKPSQIGCAALVVIDLNDLKKTNDLQGHRMGDQLIYSFASLLKESCNLFPRKPFLGRYGGDEFIIYHRNLENEATIKSFLKELAYLVEEFNKEEQRFQISYAAGYSLNVVGGQELSIREMFDHADENMYQNKIADKMGNSQEIPENCE